MCDLSQFRAAAKDREKCVECPFKEGTIYYRLHKSWAKEVAEGCDQKGIPQRPAGCHMIDPDNVVGDISKVCIGHLEYMEKRAV